MKVKYGSGTTPFGPGVEINLTAVEVATAIDAYIIARNVRVSGPRTITVNGYLCEFGRVYVDPGGFVIRKGKKINGSGGPDEEVVHMRCHITPVDLSVYQDTPIFTEKPWLRFRTHPTNPRGRK